ncbi:hypothetical protein F2Q69_00036465 [Brassica cretica]|uniref:Uncharacterized protein n=1 Tax=Brassica cretica TaxID=69181 RepID=A0A8S9SL29_BRACR|nr:hypothetical protein F2Q69_00036465 [Brassica cretica]
MRRRREKGRKKVPFGPIGARLSHSKLRANGVAVPDFHTTGLIQPMSFDMQHKRRPIDRQKPGRRSSNRSMNPNQKHYRIHYPHNQFATFHYEDQRFFASGLGGGLTVGDEFSILPQGPSVNKLRTNSIRRLTGI